VGRIVFDSFDELDRLAQLHADDGLRPKVLVRATPGIEAHTHDFIRTGQVDSKFGFGVAAGDAARAVARAQDSPAVELVGVHMHIGSQVFVADFFHDAVEAVAPWVREMGLPELSIGGGLGVAYVEGEQAPSITEWGSAIVDGCRDAGITARVTAEPGRSIVAQAAVTLYTVGTIKDIPGVRTYASVDGGMSDNPRPQLYDAVYTALSADRASEPGRERVSIAGMHCESGDVLIDDVALPTPRRGDLLAVPATGAYTLSMASNYNGVTRPAAVLVSEGEARLIRRREVLDDLLRAEV
jgi:diaminopimelate decarboxylase